MIPATLFLFLAGGAGTCKPLQGGKFESVREVELKITDKGPVKGHWYVTFNGDQMSWSYGDPGTSFTFTCAKGVITAHSGGETLRGRYDPKTGVLDWEGMKYKRP